MIGLKTQFRIPREIDMDSANKILSLIKEFDVKSFLEVGVLYGDMAKYLCENYSFDKYYGVDSWLNTNFGLYRFSQKEINQVYFFCLKQLKKFNNIWILKMNSMDASEILDDFDAIFIDAAHDSQSVTEDINVWLPKAKKLLVGHDYVLWEGVRRAVDFTIPQRKIYNNLWYLKK